MEPQQTDQTRCIDRYLELIRRYRTTLNLVSPTDDSVLDRLIARSRVFAELVESTTSAGDTIVDVGSGAGIPAIVVACTLPDRTVVLVERRRRRAGFLDLVQAHLGLSNVDVVHDDAANLEGYRARAVTAQSVMRLDRLYCTTRHLHADTVVLISGKGPAWTHEVADLVARTGTAPAETIERHDPTRGTLLALRLQGGRPCRSSASSTKKGA